MAKYAPGDTSTEYVPPTVEEYNKPPTGTSPNPSTSGGTSGLASEAEPLTAIFIRRLDELHQFVLGRWPDNTDAGRRKFIIDIVKMFESLGNADYRVAKPVIHHFLGNINSAYHPYDDGAFNGPLFKPAPPRSLNIDRYFSLLSVLTSLAYDIRHRTRYVAGLDLSYLLRGYSVKQQTTYIAIIRAIANRL